MSPSSEKSDYHYVSKIYKCCVKFHLSEFLVILARGVYTEAIIFYKNLLTAMGTGQCQRTRMPFLVLAGDIDRPIEDSLRQPPKSFGLNASES